MEKESNEEDEYEVEECAELRSRRGRRGRTEESCVLMHKPFAAQSTLPLPLLPPLLSPVTPRSPSLGGMRWQAHKMASTHWRTRTATRGSCVKTRKIAVRAPIMVEKQTPVSPPPSSPPCPFFQPRSPAQRFNGLALFSFPPLNFASTDTNIRTHKKKGKRKESLERTIRRKLT